MKKPDVKFYAALLCCVSLAFCLAAQIHANQRIQMDRDALAARGEEELARTRAELEERRAAWAELEERLEAREAELVQAMRRDNPIDQYFFSQRRESSITVYGTTLESSFYRQAWEREFAHAVEWVRADCATTFEADLWLLENYRETVEAQAQQAEGLFVLRAAGEYTPEERRDYFVLGRLMWAEINFAAAEAYRQGTFWLLDTYSYAISWKTLYPFAFNEETRQEILEDMGAPQEIEMFPPLAQVLEESRAFPAASGRLETALYKPLEHMLE